MTTDFICGQAGCAAIGMAFVAAIMLLVAIGWFYELWRQRANRYLEGIGSKTYGVRVTSRLLTNTRINTAQMTRTLHKIS